ncbi:hypothetical protein RMATCC62417_15162 [Rhizopus microsporus]|nr:hypothetical protein RMATCC62417_15162 [Rhizopus microsporus]
MRFNYMNNAIKFVEHILNNVTTIYVADNEVRELFGVVKVFRDKSFSAVVRDIKGQKRELAGSSENQPQKRLHTPSPVRVAVDQQFEELLSYFLKY